MTQRPEASEEKGTDTPEEAAKMDSLLFFSALGATANVLAEWPWAAIAPAARREAREAA